MTSCTTSSITVLVTAFSPLTEIFVSVPLGVGLGLSPFFSAFLSVLGNISAGLTVLAFADLLARNTYIAPFVRWLESGKARTYVQEYGLTILVLATPLMGIWGALLASRFVGMKPTRSFLATSLSVSLYCLVLGGLLHLGVSWT